MSSRAIAAVSLRNEARQAADAVAAHLRLGSVRVEDAHAVIGVLVARRQRKDDAVAANAEVAVTQRHRLLCTDQRLRLRAVVHLHGASDSQKYWQPFLPANFPGAVISPQHCQQLPTKTPSHQLTLGRRLSVAWHS